MTREKNIHWDYYLALESDIEGVDRYIEFDQANFNTYSIEFAHLLLAASSEVDVVLKELCQLLSPQSKTANIKDYKKIIKEHIPSMIEKEVVSSKYGFTLSPWSNWIGDKNPIWWESYNKVKHERSVHFGKANLENVLNSIAGLLVANIYFNHQKFCAENKGYPYDLRNSLRTLSPPSRLFRLVDRYMLRNKQR